MGPKVFVSSTFYDLKHIRENLRNFIENYGFEPILFESGNLYFSHTKEMDESCYTEVKNSDIIILIIGGRYESASSDTKNLEIYTSITQKEYQTAQAANLPCYVFIDKFVYIEYETYKNNEKMFKEKDLSSFSFRYVDNIKVFDFIDEVRDSFIKTFENFDEIQRHLKNQWAGLFLEHIQNIKSRNNQSKIEDSFVELTTLTEKMNLMIEKLSANIITDSTEFEQLTISKSKIELEAALSKLFNMTKEYINDYSHDEKHFSKIYLTNFLIHTDVYKEVARDEDFDFHEITLTLSETELNSFLSLLVLPSQKVYAEIIHYFIEKVYSLLNSDDMIDFAIIFIATEYKKFVISQINTFDKVNALSNFAQFQKIINDEITDKNEEI